MFKNENIMEDVFKSNNIFIQGNEHMENRSIHMDDKTPVFIGEYVMSPSGMMVHVEAALLSVLFITDNSDNSNFVVFCNARYSDIKNTKAFSGNYTIYKVLDAPEGSIYSFGAIKKMVEDKLITADQNLDFNIGIITMNSDNKAYPLNEEFVDVTRISPEKNCIVIAHHVKDILEFEKASAEHNAEVEDDGPNPVDVDVATSDDPAMPIEGNDGSPM